MPYYAEELSDDELDDGEELDRALIRHPMGLTDFRPRPAWGSDPSQIGWPPTLPMELALHVDTTQGICASHGISRQDWDRLRVNPAFIADLKRAAEAVRDGAGSFKARSQLQAQELLKRSWQIIHDPKVPPAVAANLIQATVKWAGLDASKDQGTGKLGGSGFMIQINLG